MALVSEAIPFISCTKEIMISQDDRQLASRTVDNHAPKVMIISPSNGGTLTGNVIVKWQASDADGGNLTYFVLYSPDAGRSWQTIASDIKDTQLTVQMAELPGSSRALFRVIATDGVNTGISDSNSTFRVTIDWYPRLTLHLIVSACLLVVSIIDVPYNNQIYPGDITSMTIEGLLP